MQRPNRRQKRVSVSGSRYAVGRLGSRQEPRSATHLLRTAVRWAVWRILRLWSSWYYGFGSPFVTLPYGFYPYSYYGPYYGPYYGFPRGYSFLARSSSRFVHSTPIPKRLGP